MFSSHTGVRYRAVAAADEAYTIGQMYVMESKFSGSSAADALSSAKLTSAQPNKSSRTRDNHQQLTIAMANNMGVLEPMKPTQKGFHIGNEIFGRKIVPTLGLGRFSVAN